MQNAPIFMTFTVTTDAAAMSATRLVGNFSLVCPAANAGNVTFYGDGTDTAIWVPGEWHQFRAIDLARVRVSGSDGDAVVVSGHTI